MTNTGHNKPDLECTWWPDTWFGISIQDCCITHDLGGSDWELFMCVSDKGLFIIGLVMFIGLIFGKPIYRILKGIKNESKS